MNDLNLIFLPSAVRGENRDAVLEKLDVCFVLLALCRVELEHVNTANRTRENTSFVVVSVRSMFIIQHRQQEM